MAYVRKRVYKKGKGRRYAKKASGPKKFNYVKRTGNLARDVAKLKKQVKNVKPEVKTTQGDYSQPYIVACGQVDANATGAHIMDITPQLACSGNEGGRIGDNVKFIGMAFRMKLQQMSALSIRSRYRIELWKTYEMSAPVSIWLSQVYKADSISGVIDYNSTKALINRKMNKLIASRRGSIEPDAITTTNTYRDIKLFVKRQDVADFSINTATEPSNFRYLLVVTMDGGNCNTTTACTITNPYSVPLTAVNTGIYLSYTINFYYIDP